MNDAVRGDFERLRARRQRRGRADQPVSPTPAPARVVLTPTPPIEAHDGERAGLPGRVTEGTSVVPRRSWVRSVLRRG